MGKPLTRDATHCARFFLNLCDRFVGSNGKATRALETDSDSPGKFTLDAFRTYWLMASGAQWVRDSNGNFQLVETNGAKTEAVVIEFLNDLGIPFWIFTSKGAKKTVGIRQMATLFELGVSLNVESFKRS
mgnify:CR=1 FL=1